MKKYKKPFFLTLVILSILSSIAIFLNMKVLHPFSFFKKFTFFKVKISKLIEPRIYKETSGFYYYTNVSESKIFEYCSKNDLRLIDIEVRTDSTNPSNRRYDILFGPTDGSNKQTCWFVTRYTKSQLDNYLSTKNARILDLEIHGSNKNRYTAILIKKEYNSSKFKYYTNINASSLSSQMAYVSSINERVIDIEVYKKNNSRKYAIVTVPNLGINKKSWYWIANVDSSEVLSYYKEKINSVDMIDIERYENGKYSAIFNQTKGNPYKTFMTNLTFEEIAPSYKSRDSRIIDIERFKNSSGQSRFSIVMASNMADRFHDKHSEANAALKNFLANSDAKGVTVSIIKDNKIHYSMGAGYSNEDKLYRMSPYNTMHRWASTTKGLVSLAAVVMDRKGLIDIDRPINQYWDKFESGPEYFDDLAATYLEEKGSSLPRPVIPSIRDLLSMRSGIQNYERYDDCDEDCETTQMLPERIEEINPEVNTGIRWLIERWINKPLGYPQGFYEYSNPGYNLACIIIEEAYKKKTGVSKKFFNLLKSQVLDPLNMNTVQVDYPWESSLLDTKAYLTSGDEFINETCLTDSSGDEYGCVYEDDVSSKMCAGGIESTTIDVARYLEDLITQETVVTQSDLDTLWDIHTEKNLFGTRLNYGLGFRIYRSNHFSGYSNSVWHHGGQSGAKNHVRVYLDPCTSSFGKAGIVIRTNVFKVPMEDIDELRVELEEIFEIGKEFGPACGE